MSRRANRLKVFHRGRPLPRALLLRWAGLALLGAMVLLFAARLGALSR